jgi:hypothetical protein
LSYFEKYKINTRCIVWVLFGGDHPDVNSSLMTGINVLLNLSEIPGFRVEAFFLAPLNPSKSDKKRLKRTLNIRNKQLLLGLPHYMIDDVFHKSSIKRPSQLDKISVRMRPVWAVPVSIALHSSAQEIQDECERRVKLNTRSEGFRTDSEREYVDLHIMARIELEAAGITSKLLSTHDYNDYVSEILPCSKRMDLETFAMEARLQGATVMLAAQAASLNGHIQSFFDNWSVLYTGSGSYTVNIMQDKHETYLSLDNLRHHGIGSAVIHIINYSEILILLQQDPSCLYCFEYFRRLISQSRKPLCIQPINTPLSRSIAVLDTAADLSLYLKAVRDGCRSIPANTLAISQEAIKLPGTRTSYRLETFVGNFQSSAENIPMMTKASTAEDPSKSNFSLAVTVGLVGESKDLKVLNPRLTAMQSENVYISGGIRTFVSPVEVVDRRNFEKIISFDHTMIILECMESFKKKILLVANHLRISGVAKLDTLLELETGDSVITEINLFPKMSSYAVIIQQVASVNSPILPRNFFQKILENTYRKKLHHLKIRYSDENNLISAPNHVAQNDLENDTTINQDLAI